MERRVLVFSAGVQNYDGIAGLLEKREGIPSAILTANRHCSFTGLNPEESDARRLTV
jgi:hypothetical protein